MAGTPVGETPRAPPSGAKPQCSGPTRTSIASRGFIARRPSAASASDWYRGDGLRVEGTAQGIGEVDVHVEATDRVEGGLASRNVPAEEPGAGTGLQGLDTAVSRPVDDDEGTSEEVALADESLPSGQRTAWARNAAD